MKTLGLDLGPDSIGWAVADVESENILGAGSRIIPMDANELDKYDAGKLQSAASERTGYRGVRRMFERASLRRARLLRVLNILGFLPEHYKRQVDFSDHPGTFREGCEPLTAYAKSATGKYEFIFKNAFEEMLADFRAAHPELFASGTRLIPRDWTLYYLRKKALTRPVSKEELAWILLSFNAKRGYYQRNEADDEPKNEIKEYTTLSVVSVEQLNEDSAHPGQYFFDVTFTGGIVKRRRGPRAPYSVGDTISAVVTTKLDKEGKPKTDSEGSVVRDCKFPSEDDWGLVMAKTQEAIDRSGKTVGAFIYDSILANPLVKIKGGAVKTIERKYYRSELYQILEAQRRFIPELSDRRLYEACIQELYSQNLAHAANLRERHTLTDMLVSDVIFYQRPLKSKKSCIAGCPYESLSYTDAGGRRVEKRIKVMPKSKPLFEEFRLRQFISNIHVIKNEGCDCDSSARNVDVTIDYLRTHEQVCAIFHALREKKEIDQKGFLTLLHLSPKEYHWNYDEKRKYPCSPTHHAIASRIGKLGREALSEEEENALWHILYSVSDKEQLDKALRSFARNHGFAEEEFSAAFATMPVFTKDYASYSEKATRKLLSLMRAGSDWSYEAIPEDVRQRIDHIIDGEADDTIPVDVREKLMELREPADFQGLPLWAACYVAYGRHSESSDCSAWQNPEDIDEFLSGEFRREPMRNPVVERVVGETLRLVRDIWKNYGRPDEIHIEMARDLKLPADKRAKATQRMQENQSNNEKLRRELEELAEGKEVDGERAYGVRPHSPQHLLKYKLWKEQKHRSPYTGKGIPLPRLFTSDYEIDHIIPQARYYDDSFNNKVVVEADANKNKSDRLAYEFILAQGESPSSGILSKEEYEGLVESNFKDNPRKQKNLLLKEIPASFSSAQLNNTRYIARRTAEILSHVVREAGDKSGISTRVILTGGNITDSLKADWGLKQIWSEMMAPRFERLNRITASHDYGQWVERDGRPYFESDVPEKISEKGFSKKRIDHRHHAMDAIVIACTSRRHVQYFNNESARSVKTATHQALRQSLRDGDKHMRKPWPTFTQDARAVLEGIVVSFKANRRVLARTSNFYTKYVGGKKVRVKQAGDNYAIRKPLHKETVFGLVRVEEKKAVRLSEALKTPEKIVDRELRRAIQAVVKQYAGLPDSEKLIKRYFRDRGNMICGRDVSRIEIRYLPTLRRFASRVPVTSIDKDKKIDSITDATVRNILKRHLAKYAGDYKAAFSETGVEEMNANIAALNDGHPHMPIKRVRTTETSALKFAIGQSGPKAAKFVEAEKGTGLFFAIYVDEDGRRSFRPVSFREAVERKRQGLPPAPDELETGERLLFTLSPLDLVYVPAEGEHVTADSLNPKRIYKMVSYNTATNQCQFVPQTFAQCIADKIELGPQNKSEYTIQLGKDDGERQQIKKVCLKLEVDRLGRVTKILGL